MGTLKKYRFKLAWQNFRVGAVIEPTGVVRDWLMANGYIEPAPEAPAADPQPAEAGATPDPPAAPAFVRKRQRAFP